MLKRFVTPGLSVVVLGLVLLVQLAIAAPALATGVYQMPPLSEATWVVDDANVLSRVNEGKLTNQFQALAQDAGIEVRFVTLHRLDYGETPESFAADLMQKWFPDPERQKNQAILVLDDVTNRAALEVGSDLRTLVPDRLAHSITAETIGIPLREASKYNQALLDASDRLIAVLSGNPDPGAPAETTSFEIESTFASAEETDENRSNATIIVVGFLIAATVIPMATYYLYQSLGG